MRLIGMLDSPYVRRVAIALDALEIDFKHESLSVFTTFPEFSAINPVVKAPTLVCDDGGILMDSSLILQFVEASCGRSLWPIDVSLQSAFGAVSLAQAACEKSAQIVYERKLRPKAMQYEPWVERVTAQLRAAYGALEQEVASRPEVFADAGQHPAIAAAVAWGFTQAVLAPLVPADDHPALAKLASRAEQSIPFLKYPAAGPGVPTQAA
ncbi:MAG: glutathione S-transferase family protein [Pseudomonadota bacterium]|nr:glutathione S-transferase family protein [Pseudomonadota bacterium]